MICTAFVETNNDQEIGFFGCLKRRRVEFCQCHAFSRIGNGGGSIGHCCGTDDTTNFATTSAIHSIIRNARLLGSIASNYKPGVQWAKSWKVRVKVERVE